MFRCLFAVHSLPIRCLHFSAYSVPMIRRLLTACSERCLLREMHLHTDVLHHDMLDLVYCPVRLLSFVILQPPFVMSDCLVDRRLTTEIQLNDTVPERWTGSTMSASRTGFASMATFHCSGSWLPGGNIPWNLHPSKCSRTIAQWVGWYLRCKFSRKANTTPFDISRFVVVRYTNPSIDM